MKNYVSVFRTLTLSHYPIIVIKLFYLFINNYTYYCVNDTMEKNNIFRQCESPECSLNGLSICDRKKPISPRRAEGTGAILKGSAVKCRY